MSLVRIFLLVLFIEVGSSQNHRFQTSDRWRNQGAATNTRRNGGQQGVQAGNQHRVFTQNTISRSSTGSQRSLPVVVTNTIERESNRIFRPGVSSLPRDSAGNVRRPGEGRTQARPGSAVGVSQNRATNFDPAVFDNIAMTRRMVTRSNSTQNSRSSTRSRGSTRSASGNVPSRRTSRRNSVRSSVGQSLREPSRSRSNFQQQESFEATARNFQPPNPIQPNTNKPFVGQQSVPYILDSILHGTRDEPAGRTQQRTNEPVVGRFADVIENSAADPFVTRQPAFDRRSQGRISNSLQMAPEPVRQLVVEPLQNNAVAGTEARYEQHINHKVRAVMNGEEIDISIHPGVPDNASPRREGRPIVPITPTPFEYAVLPREVIEPSVSRTPIRPNIVSRTSQNDISPSFSRNTGIEDNSLRSSATSSIQQPLRSPTSSWDDVLNTINEPSTQVRTSQRSEVRARSWEPPRSIPTTSRPSFARRQSEQPSITSENEFWWETLDGPENNRSTSSQQSFRSTPTNRGNSNERVPDSRGINGRIANEVFRIPEIDTNPRESRVSDRSVSNSEFRPPPTANFDRRSAQSDSFDQSRSRTPSSSRRDNVIEPGRRQRFGRIFSELPQSGNDALDRSTSAQSHQNNNRNNDASQRRTESNTGRSSEQQGFDLDLFMLALDRTAAQTSPSPITNNLETRPRDNSFVPEPLSVRPSTFDTTFDRRSTAEFGTNNRLDNFNSPRQGRGRTDPIPDSINRWNNGPTRMDSSTIDSGLRNRHRNPDVSPAEIVASGPSRSIIDQPRGSGNRVSSRFTVSSDNNNRRSMSPTIDTGSSVQNNENDAGFDLTAFLESMSSADTQSQTPSNSDSRFSRRDNVARNNERGQGRLSISDNVAWNNERVQRRPSIIDNVAGNNERGQGRASISENRRGRQNENVFRSGGMIFDSQTTNEFVNQDRARGVNAASRISQRENIRRQSNTVASAAGQTVQPDGSAVSTQNGNSTSPEEFNLERFLATLDSTESPITTTSTTTTQNQAMNIISNPDPIPNLSLISSLNSLNIGDTAPFLSFPSIPMAGNTNLSSQSSVQTSQQETGGSSFLTDLLGLEASNGILNMGNNVINEIPTPSPQTNIVSANSNSLRNVNQMTQSTVPPTTTSTTRRTTSIGTTPDSSQNREIRIALDSVQSGGSSQNQNPTYIVVRIGPDGKLVDTQTGTRPEPNISRLLESLVTTQKPTTTQSTKLNTRRPTDKVSATTNASLPKTTDEVSGLRVQLNRQNSLLQELIKSVGDRGRGNTRAEQQSIHREAQAQIQKVSTRSSIPSLEHVNNPERTRIRERQHQQVAINTNQMNPLNQMGTENIDMSKSLNVMGRLPERRIHNAPRRSSVPTHDRLHEQQTRHEEQSLTPDTSSSLSAQEQRYPDGPSVPSHHRLQQQRDNFRPPARIHDRLQENGGPVRSSGVALDRLHGNKSPVRSSNPALNREQERRNQVRSPAQALDRSQEQRGPVSSSVPSLDYLQEQRNNARPSDPSFDRLQDHRGNVRSSVHTVDRLQNNMGPVESSVPSLDQAKQQEGRQVLENQQHHSVNSRERVNIMHPLDAESNHVPPYLNAIDHVQVPETRQRSQRNRQTHPSRSMAASRLRPMEALSGPEPGIPVSGSRQTSGEAQMHFNQQPIRNPIQNNDRSLNAPVVGSQPIQYHTLETQHDVGYDVISPGGQLRHPSLPGNDVLPPLNLEPELAALRKAFDAAMFDKIAMERTMQRPQSRRTVASSIMDTNANSIISNRPASSNQVLNPVDSGLQWLGSRLDGRQVHAIESRPRPVTRESIDKAIARTPIINDNSLNDVRMARIKTHGTSSERFVGLETKHTLPTSKGIRSDSSVLPSYDSLTSKILQDAQSDEMKLAVRSLFQKVGQEKALDIMKDLAKSSIDRTMEVASSSRKASITKEPINKSRIQNEKSVRSLNRKPNVNLRLHDERNQNAIEANNARGNILDSAIMNVLKMERLPPKRTTTVAPPVVATLRSVSVGRLIGDSRQFIERLSRNSGDTRAKHIVNGEVIELQALDLPTIGGRLTPLEHFRFGNEPRFRENLRRKKRIRETKKVNLIPPLNKTTSLTSKLNIPVAETLWAAPVYKHVTVGTTTKARPPPLTTEDVRKGSKMNYLKQELDRLMGLFSSAGL